MIVHLSKQILINMATILKHWREAATLIIAAKSKNIANRYSYEILMLKRSGKSKFMPSWSVFPGGVAEDADFSPEWVGLFSSLDNDIWPKTFAHFANVGQGPPMFSRQRDEHYSKIPSEVAFRICAIRETFEECGILLTRSSNDNKKKTLTEATNIAKNYGKIGNITISDFEIWREKVDKDATQFIKMCQEFNMVPDIWSLTEWSNWLTPVNMVNKDRRASGTDKGSKRRYDTAFFLCLLDTVPDAMHDDKETVHLQWFPPDELIKSHLESKVKLAPPQIYEICRFLNFKDMEELNEFCLTRINKRVTRNFPVPAICDDGMFILYPGVFVCWTSLSWTFPWGRNSSSEGNRDVYSY
ncbi:acyl-coenzyme A diphosphatase NUDT19-like isoform X2 [Mytilus galloprovincialis]|uniref:acyl-coenzyme A diphosphatase NUDT19-like isoform X2 n=1 Tax=Mytilus galloprovincialis TaxID=29158 RepID=UPI003F7C17DD